MPVRSTERVLLAGAAVVGLVHAAFSLYWAVGGDWLFRTVGQWAVSLRDDAPVAGGVALAAVAVVKGLVAVTPLVAGSMPLPRPRLWRGAAWVAAAVLTGYGAVNSVTAWLVLAGLVRPEGGYDRQSMIGHALLWDPLFLLWGLLLGAGLLAGRRTGRAGGAPS